MEFEGYVLWSLRDMWCVKNVFENMVCQLERCSGISKERKNKKYVVKLKMYNYKKSR